MEENRVSRIRTRIADSAIDFALGAFWVAVWGAVVTAAAVLVAAASAVPATWIFALGGAFVAFVVVATSTAGLVWLKHRRVPKPPAVMGRKGFLNFKIEGGRALVANATHLHEITRETARIGEIMAAGSRKVDRITASGRDVDERAYRQARSVASQLQKRVRRMELHVDRFAADTDLWLSNFTSWIEWSEREGTLENLAGLQPVLASLLMHTQEARPNTQGFRDGAERIRGMSDDMDVAAGRLVATLDIVLAKMVATEQFCADAMKRLGARGLGSGVATPLIG